MRVLGVAAIRFKMEAIAQEFPDIPAATDLDDLKEGAQSEAWHRAYGAYWALDSVIQNAES